MPRKALLIGVGKYTHYPSLAALADSDLGRVESALRNAGVLDIARLGGGGAEVTVATLRSTIAGFIEKAPAGADLLVYFTGHDDLAARVRRWLTPAPGTTRSPAAAWTKDRC